MSELETADSRGIASLTVRRHVTRLPRSDAERALPLQQLKQIKQYDVPAILDRANSATQRRLRELLDHLQRPFGAASSSSSSNLQQQVNKSPECQKSHCDYFVEHGIYKRVDAGEEQRRPTLGGMRVFTVVELEKQRLRTIHWSQQQNDAIYEQGYEAHVPELRHISNFLPSVFAECGVVGDISASFYGLVIDERARQFYRFRDNDGNLYEMCRMMMGHVLAAEIQHIITCIIAGHPDYVAPRLACKIPVDVWIDNVRYTGTQSAVEAAAGLLAATSHDVNAAMNIEKPSRAYDFIGVRFDHSIRSVSLAKKTLNKLPRELPQSIRADDLEGLIGRLVFASAVQQQPLINKWWTLKWARRFFNQLNRGIISGVDEIPLTSSAAHKSLSVWLAEARHQHVVVIRNASQRSATLFTDATLEGWGGVLIDDNNEIFVSGGKFPATRGNYVGNIAPHEAWAIDLSLNAFAQQISGLAQLNLFVDNTSVQHGVARGQVNAESLVTPVRSILCKIISNRISLLVDYVNTKINPADAISRGQRLDVAKVQLAMKEIFKTERKGAVVGRLVG